jgi:ribulose bisphosphate carboxylase small subunit
MKDSRSMTDGEFRGIVLYRKMVEGEILLTIRKDRESIEQTYTKIGWGIDPSRACVLMSHEFIIQPSGRLAVVRCIH